MEWLSQDEAAERLGVSRPEISRMVVLGQLTSTSGGKVSGYGVRALVKARAEKAKADAQADARDRSGLVG